MRISMLGQSGSGKTSYMCALHEQMIMNEYNYFTIMPKSNENYSYLESIGEIDKIAFSRNNKIEFPDGTTKTTFWTFDLMYNNKSVCDLDWIDYRGGKIGEIFSGDEEANSIKSLIYQSNAIIIFIDSIQLALYEDIQICRKVTGIDKLGILLRDYDRNENDEVVILLALSKCDSSLIPDDYKRSDYLPLILKCQQVCNDIISLAQRNRERWHIGIMPVSAVGIGNTNSQKKDMGQCVNRYQISTTLIGYPKPNNVVESFLFCVQEIVDVAKRKEMHSAQIYSEKQAREFMQSSLFNVIISKLTKKVSHYECAMEYIERKEVSQSQIEQLEEVLKVLNPQVYGKVVQL